jgi:hypothetical protein
LNGALSLANLPSDLAPAAVSELEKIKIQLEEKLHPECKKLLDNWPATKRKICEGVL